MLENCERLPFGFEARDHLLAVHAGLENLERDAAFDRLTLFGEIDDGHAALAEDAEDAIGADTLRMLECTVIRVA